MKKLVHRFITLTLVFPILGSFLHASEYPWDPFTMDSTKNVQKSTTQINRPQEIGSYYEVEVPDTLDLAEHARLGLNHLSSIICPQHKYEMYWGGAFGFDMKTGQQISPANLNLWWSSLQACQPKCAETMVMQRLMSGSTQGLDVEAKMLEMLASHIGEEGIYWVPKSRRRPGSVP